MRRGGGLWADIAAIAAFITLISLALTLFAP